MLKHFLIALVLAIAYVGLQYDFTKKPKKQKNVFIMASIIFFVTFVGCWLLLPNKKSVKFNNSVEMKEYNKTKSLTDGDGYHDDDGSGSSEDGSLDDGGDGRFDYQPTTSSQSTSSIPDSIQTPSLTSGPIGGGGVMSPLPATSTIPSSSLGVSGGEVPFPS